MAGKASGPASAAVLLLLALPACLPGSAPAPDAAPALPPPAARPALAKAPESLARPIRAAVARAASAEAAHARQTGARASLHAARSGWQPQLDLVSELGGSSDTQLRLRQLVFDAGGQSHRIRAGTADLRASEQDAAAGAAALALSAVEAWADVRLHRSLATLARQDLTAHGDFLARIRTRLAQGVATEAERLMAESRHSTAAAAMAEAQAGRERAELRFRTLFGHAPATELAPLPAAPGVTAAGQSPRLAALIARETAAEARLAAARADIWPRLVAGARAGEHQQRTFLSVEYSVFSGGQRAAAISAAEAGLSEARATRRELEEQLGRELGEAGITARAGRARLAASRAAAGAAAESLSAVEHQIALGRSRITDLLDAQRDLTAARRAEALAAADKTLTGYVFLAVTGDILAHFGIAAEAAGPGRALGSSPDVQPSKSASGGAP